MRKRLIFAALLLLLCLTPLSGLGEEYRAVVANPKAADRLNLRKGPDTASATLGRFYSGTPLTVLEEKGEWARVRIGGLEGYMLREYLMKSNRNYGAPSNFYTARTTKANVSLREEAKNSAEQVGVISGDVYLLADAGDDWRYVYSPSANSYGFVRTNQLTSRQVEIDLAYLYNESGRVTIYGDKNLKTKTAVYYSGTRVRVTAMERAGYARVEMYGIPWTSEYAGSCMRGYVDIEDLMVFVQPWQVPCFYPTGKLLQGVSMESQFDLEIVSIPQGAYVAVLGELEEEYHVLYGQTSSGVYSTGFIRKDRIALMDRLANNRGAGAIGYAYMNIAVDPEGYALPLETYATPGGERDEDIYEPLAQVVGMENGYLQLSSAGDRNFFVLDEQAQIILEEQLTVDKDGTLAAGEWVADSETQGLWELQVAAGQQAKLTIEYGPLGKMESYEAEGKAAYAVYIPAGATVRLTGEGRLRSGLHTAIYAPQNHAAHYGEDEILFSGSGRFFCPDQLVDHSTWFDYVISPIPGAEESYCVFSHLFTEEGEETVIFFDEETTRFRTDQYTLCPGAFVELYHCQIRVHYGNG